MSGLGAQGSSERSADRVASVTTPRRARRAAPTSVLRTAAAGRTATVGADPTDSANAMVPTFAPPLTRRAGLCPAGAAAAVDARHGQLLPQHEVLHQQVVAGAQRVPKQTEEQDEVETHAAHRSAIIPHIRASIFTR